VIGKPLIILDLEKVFSPSARISALAARRAKSRGGGGGGGKGGAKKEDEEKSQTDEEVEASVQNLDNFMEENDIGDEPDFGWGSHVELGPPMAKENGFNLTNGEAAILHAYTSNDHYGSVNEALRGGKPAAEFQAYEKSVNIALSKLPAHRGDAYRGLTLTAGEQARYKVGMVVTEKGFTSASKVKSEAANFAFDNKVTGTLATNMTIKSKTAANFKKLHALDPKNGMQEVVFKSKTKFKVTSNDGKGNIGLEEV